MIAHLDTVLILSRVAAEPDRTKKRAGLRLLALLRRDGAREPAPEQIVGSIARDLGAVAAGHAERLLRATGLA